MLAGLGGLARPCRSHMTPVPGFTSKSQPLLSANLRKLTLAVEPKPLRSSTTWNVSPGLILTIVLSPSMSIAIRVRMGMPLAGVYCHVWTCCAPGGAAAAGAGSGSGRSHCVLLVCG